MKKAQGPTRNCTKEIQDSDPIFLIIDDYLSDQYDDIGVLITWFLNPMIGLVTIQQACEGMFEGTIPGRVTRMCPRIIHLGSRLAIFH